MTNVWNAETVKMGITIRKIDVIEKQTRKPYISVYSGKELNGWGV